MKKEKSTFDPIQIHLNKALHFTFSFIFLFGIFRFNTNSFAS